jgi:hypothetical protein
LLFDYCIILIVVAVIYNNTFVAARLEKRFPVLQRYCYSFTTARLSADDAVWGNAKFPSYSVLMGIYGGSTLQSSDITIAYRKDSESDSEPEMTDDGSRGDSNVAGRKRIFMDMTDDGSGGYEDYDRLRSRCGLSQHDEWDASYDNHDEKPHVEEPQLEEPHDEEDPRDEEVPRVEEPQPPNAVLHMVHLESARRRENRLQRR